MVSASGGAVEVLQIDSQSSKTSGSLSRYSFLSNTLRACARCPTAPVLLADRAGNSHPEYGFLRHGGSPMRLPCKKAGWGLRSILSRVRRAARANGVKCSPLSTAAPLCQSCSRLRIIEETFQARSAAGSRWEHRLSSMQDP